MPTNIGNERHKTSCPWGAGAALLGASMMIATGVLLLDEAYARSILVEAAAIVEHCSVATKIP